MPFVSELGDFLNRMFTEERFAQDVETDYESIEVPDSYTGPRLSFPLLPDHATALVEAFRLRQVSLGGNVGASRLAFLSKGRPNQCRKCSQAAVVHEPVSRMEIFALFIPLAGRTMRDAGRLPPSRALGMQRPRAADTLVV